MPPPSATPPRPNSEDRARDESQQPTEAELVDGLRSGDKASLSTLYDRHAMHVFTLAHKILRSEADAELVVSDVFLEIWRKSERFEESRGTFRTYLLVLTRSRSLDLLRAQSRRDERTHDGGRLLAEEHEARQEHDRPLPQAIQTEHRQRVKEAVEQLDAKQREPIELAYFEGLTHRQIADRLDEPLGTVKTRVRAALQALRSSLRAIGRHDDELS
ncbi:MAG: sigma-70 family RNA polymerase sigma factor [Planctomycetota bacterium]